MRIRHRYWRFLAGSVLAFSTFAHTISVAQEPVGDNATIVRPEVKVLQSQEKSTAWIDASVAELAEIDQAIEQARVKWQVPGLSVAIVKDGKLILSKGYGTKKIGTDDPVDRDTLFAIASNSKAFTSASIAILVEEGKLRWDDKVKDYLPWLELYDPNVSQDLRIRDLLCHRSGLGTFSGDLLWYGTPYTPTELLKRLRHLPPEGVFRADYGYSNVMYLAAGEVIRTVSGKSWQEFVSDRILRPLDMQRSVVSVRDLVTQGNYATPHKSFVDRNEPIEWVNWDTMAAAGGIISSSDDMSKWMLVQLARGELASKNDTSKEDAKEIRLFSEANSYEMWEAHIPLKVSARYNQRFPSTHFRAYGLGWALSDYKGAKVVAHGGGYDGMYSQTMLIPDKKLGVVVLTNSMTGISEALCYHIVDKFMGGETRPWLDEGYEQFKSSRNAFRARIDAAIKPLVGAPTAPTHPLEDYVGKFNCPLYGDAEVKLENGKLVLALLPNPALVADLTPLHYDTFLIRWRNDFAWFDEGTAHFVCDAKGKLIELKLDVPNDDLWFHELKLKRVIQ
jgi:CubicO group peptidase (beta-lactamase class C family)